MKYFILVGFIAGLFMAFFSFSKNSNAMDVASSIQNEIPENAAKAVLAGGCFWCVESEFRSIDGVLYTISGYTGGDVENPTYKDITTGKSGHAEATEIYYDPNKVTYEELLDYFLRVAHDPTQKNRQGVDVGTQYRSAIFYESEDQKRQALAAIQSIENEKVWDNKIVTTLEPLEKFWPAEDYHQQYYEKYKDRTGRDHIRMIYKMKKKALSQ